jgi:hypothetical protein
MKAILPDRSNAILKYAAPLLAILVMSLWSSDAFAQDWANNQQIFDTSCGLLMSIKTWIFRVVYILGAIGLVIIAVSAFLGNFKFKHLISLGGGLFVVAASDMLISFAAGGAAAAC